MDTTHIQSVPMSYCDVLVGRSRAVMLAPKAAAAAATAAAAARLLFISIYDAGEKNKAVVDGSSSSLAASAQ